MNINDKFYQSCINGVGIQSYKSRDIVNIDGTGIYTMYSISVIDN